jgi:hypothetical protein
MSETEEDELNFIFEQKATLLHEILAGNRVRMPASGHLPHTT